MVYPDSGNTVDTGRSILAFRPFSAESALTIQNNTTRKELRILVHVIIEHRYYYGPSLGIYLRNVGKWAKASVRIF